MARNDGARREGAVRVHVGGVLRQDREHQLADDVEARTRPGRVVVPLPKPLQDHLHQRPPPATVRRELLRTWPPSFPSRPLPERWPPRSTTPTPNWSCEWRGKVRVVSAWVATTPAMAQRSICTERRCPDSDIGRGGDDGAPDSNRYSRAPRRAACTSRLQRADYPTRRLYSPAPVSRLFTRAARVSADVDATLPSPINTQGDEP